MINLSESQLTNTISVSFGNTPILLSSPHDGDLDNIEGITLPRDETKKRRDRNVNWIIDLIIRYLQQQKITPYAIKMQVHRKHISPHIGEYFINKLFDVVATCTSQYKKVYLLDIHGFVNQRVFGKFDLILGTLHRKSVYDSNFDLSLGNALQAKGYNVYIPSEKSVEGERFTAEAEHTVVQRLFNEKIPQLYLIQLEIEQSFRIPIGNPKGQKLAEDISTTLLELLPSFLMATSPGSMHE